MRSARAFAAFAFGAFAFGVCVRDPRSARCRARFLRSVFAFGAFGPAAAGGGCVRVRFLRSGLRSARCLARFLRSEFAFGVCVRPAAFAFAFGPAAKLVAIL